MLDFFKSKKRVGGEMSDKRKLISKIIVAVVLIGGIIVGFLTSGNTETEVNVADVFRFRFSIVDAIVIGLLFVVYIVIRINRRRNGGK